MQKVPRYHPTHTIYIAADSLLNKILKCKKPINSFHHQMTDKLGEGIRFSAVAADVVIEAIEHIEKNRFVLGLQYYPKAMYKRNVGFARIFEYFTSACREHNCKKL